MAYAPPSYKAAAYRIDHLWTIIAPYVQLHDLYSACLVSRQWHQVFSPLLWGSPASRFGYENDDVYLSLTKFKRLLARTRLDVRRLVHTLHIPPAQPEFYDGPQAAWLRDVLDRLPSLQALIVSNLSFFDHQSLQTMHPASCVDSKYPLKLLIASECQNTTATSLATALVHFPELVYLDLSSSQGSRSPYVLGEIGYLCELRVLKLRNCGLRDDDIDHLTFPTRLRSLDVSQNFLTERGLTKLLEKLPASRPARYSWNDPYNSFQSPSRRRYSGVPLPTRVLSEGMETFVIERLTSGIDGHLQVEEGLPSSFSHLYIASNHLTIDDLNQILSLPSLQLLDCGHLNLSQRPVDQLLVPRLPVAASSQRLSDLPDIEILSPTIFTHAFRTLRSLRIHHSVVTNHPFSGKELTTAEQCFELPSEDIRFELDSTELAPPNVFFEMEDTSSNVTPEPFEPPGPEAEHHASFESPDEIRVKLNPRLPLDNLSINEPDSSGYVKPAHFPTQNTHPPRNTTTPRIPVSALPTAIHSPPKYTSNPIDVPAGPEVRRYSYAAKPGQPWQQALRKPKPATPRDMIEEIILRKHRIEGRERHPGRFKPSMLPSLKSLILTDVPPTARRRHVAESLALLVQELAEEEELARLDDLARYQEVNQSPCWETATLRLQCLTLEMASGPEWAQRPRSPCRLSRNKRSSFTKSSTEDADSEMFISASETDFSFFGEDDGGLLVSKGSIDRKIKSDDGMMPDCDDGHLIDVVSELSAFRREKKRSFESMEMSLHRNGEATVVESALLGYWRGDIKVVKGLANT